MTAGPTTVTGRAPSRGVDKAAGGTLALVAASRSWPRPSW